MAGSDKTIVCFLTYTSQKTKKAIQLTVKTESISKERN